MVKQQLLLIQLQQVLQQITTNHQLKLITIITKQLQHLAIATITIITKQLHHLAIATITIITIAITLILILKLLTLVTTIKLLVAQVKKLLKHGLLIRNLVVVIQLLMVNTLVSINYLHHI